MRSSSEAARLRVSRRPAAAVLGLLAALALGTGPAASVAAGPAPSSTAAICRQLRANSGALRLGHARKHLSVLATGDSMIYPILEELAAYAPRGMKVIPERHDGTGLTTNTVNWHALAKQQVARFHPDATVITLGGRDGGIPLPGAHHTLIECCGNAWLEAYGALVRPLVRDYLRGGAGQVFWLLLPAPRERLRAPFYEAVNDALRLLAPEFHGAMHLIPVDTVITPGYEFKETISLPGAADQPAQPGRHPPRPRGRVRRAQPRRRSDAAGGAAEPLIARGRARPPASAGARG